jgi:hypothetical protein
LTFGSRRTQITDSTEIRKILKEDDYSKVIDISRVLPGDIIIYVSADGDINHSGIVVEIPSGTIVPVPKILSKWGGAHEVIHGYNYSPYDTTKIEFYRVSK